MNDFSARRTALAKAQAAADKAAAAAAKAEARRRKADAQAKAMRDALILDAVRDLFEGIDEADDPVAFMRGVMEGGTPDVDASRVSRDDSGNEASDAIGVDELM